MPLYSQYETFLITNHNEASSLLLTSTNRALKVQSHKSSSELPVRSGSVVGDKESSFRLTTATVTDSEGQLWWSSSVHYHQPGRKRKSLLSNRAQRGDAVA